jgi:hypothetical protein
MNTVRTMDVSIICTAASCAPANLPQSIIVGGPTVCSKQG